MVKIGKKGCMRPLIYLAYSCPDCFTTYVIGWFLDCCSDDVLQFDRTIFVMPGVQSKYAM